ncbi:tRNA isopentenyltransferase [Tanacetum coccineum]
MPGVSTSIPLDALFVMVALKHQNTLYLSVRCSRLWKMIKLGKLATILRISTTLLSGVTSGLLNEVRGIFDPKADYTRGIRKSIGVPELEEYLRVETKVDYKTARRLLDAAISEIKSNTCKLIDSQLSKIYRLKKELSWPINRIDATIVFEKQGNEAEDAWEDYVLQPCFKIVGDFVNGSNKFLQYIY